MVRIDKHGPGLPLQPERKAREVVESEWRKRRCASAKGDGAGGCRPAGRFAGKGTGGVAATNDSGAEAVTVSWQPVDGAAYYRVYRGTKSGEDFAVEIDTTTETSYEDASGAAGKTYYYSVTAVGASTESGFSAFVAGRR